MESADPAQEKAVVGTYRDVRGIYIDLMTGERELEDARAELEEKATGQALDGIVDDVEMFREIGQVFEGEPEMDPEVTGLNLQADPPEATLQDCWDDSDWRPVDAETGEPAPTPDDRPARRVINVRAEQNGSGEWVLTEISPEEGRSC